MPHPEREHELQIALATALRELDEAKANTHGWLSVVEQLRDNLNAALLERDGLKEALAAARRECEGLREVLDATEAARIVGLADERREKSRADAAEAALRAAVPKALKLAAQEILIAFDDACWDGLADRVRAGKWTALAAPAEET